MKTKFIAILIAISVITKVYATSPTPDQGPILNITQSKLLDFDIEIGSFKQSIKDIKILKDKIQLIPEVSPLGSDPFNQKIPYAQICLVKKLTPDQFKKLRFVEFTGVSFIPSVESHSRFSSSGGIGIGSDNISLSVDLPVLGSKKNAGISIYTDMDTSVVDPIDQSHRSGLSSVDLLDDGLYDSMNFGTTNYSGPIQKYQYFIFSLNIKSQMDPEAFWHLQDNHVENEIINSIGYSDTYNPDFGSYYGYSEETTEAPMRLLEYGVDLGTKSQSLNSSSYSYSSLTPPTISEIKEPKIEFCWTSNNYEDVTSEGAELLQPKLTMGFIK